MIFTFILNWTLNTLWWYTHICIALDSPSWIVGFWTLEEINNNKIDSQPVSASVRGTTKVGCYIQDQSLQVSSFLPWQHNMRTQNWQQSCLNTFILSWRWWDNIAYLSTLCFYVSSNIMLVCSKFAFKDDLSFKFKAHHHFTKWL